MGRINIRYIVTDVQKAVTFYEEMLGFQVEMQPAPGFAALSRDGIRLLLNEPGSGGAGQAIAGGEPAPGGWNRIQIEVDDLAATAKRLKHAGCSFRGEIVLGRGGKQILVDDPSGNPIELFEPTPRA
ncbi:glyoxalase [Mesorhizobium sp. L-8-10]|uniref:VOC family protein n=1 Tax=unclassified Mesorhizobium TaxID=325217 RepID=UPI001926C5DE|nr:MULTISPECIES: VOC family protein [unclassified Mesorhizobium]BCH27914.1 glyoxalase [Mesorhizobium sp. L-8-3]BCH35808.1 glyoxalase [Mesorhizobium sp. L-8-10]